MKAKEFRPDVWTILLIFISNSSSRSKDDAKDDPWIAPVERSHSAESELSSYRGSYRDKPIHKHARTHIKISIAPHRDKE